MSRARASPQTSAARVAELLDDALALVATAWLAVEPAQLEVLSARCGLLASELRSRSRGALRELVSSVAVGDRQLEISCGLDVLADALGVDRKENAPPALLLTAHVRLAKSGRVMRLIQSDGSAVGKQPLGSLIKPILQARRWWAELLGGADVTAIVKREGVCTSYVSRIVRLAFLSPEMVEAILAGNQRAGVDRAMLTAPGALPANWAEQAGMILPMK